MMKHVVHAYGVACVPTSGTIEDVAFPEYSRRVEEGGALACEVDEEVRLKARKESADDFVAAVAVAFNEQPLRLVWNERIVHAAPDGRVDLDGSRKPLVV
ncbi:MAG: hypothetical protein HY908_07045 [Myxococcales bacterium]|nr:hypothetical protein [Myxococcales bacterium]